MTRIPVSTALCTSLLVLTSLLLPATASSAETEVYRKETELSFLLPDLEGKKHKLSDYRGKVLLVNFWASWCPPCIHEMPELQKLQAHFTGKPFAVVSINVGEQKDKVSQFVRSLRLDLPVLLDARSKTYKHWQVSILPTSFLIDSSGRIRYRIRGNPGWDNTEILTTIDEMLP